MTLHRRKKLARKTSLKQKVANPRKTRTPVKRVNPERKAREWKRAYGSPARVQWMAWQPSVVSGLRPCENAHVRNGGMSRKADARWIVPLTAMEHRELHRVGITTFSKTYGVDLEALAISTNAAWEAR